MKFDKLTEAYMNIVNEDIDNKVFVVFSSSENNDEFKAVCRTEEAAKELVRKLDLDLIRRTGITDSKKVESFLSEFGHYYSDVNLIG